MSDEMNTYKEHQKREETKKEIAQKLVEVIKGQNINVDIALKSLDYAKSLILISTNV